TNIAVIFGDSPLEKFWVNECRREFKAFTNRISFSWLNDLSLQQIQKEVAALRPGSFILFGMMVLDAGGVPYDNDEALHRIIASAGAPVFGYFAGQFGNGAIGGRLYQDAEIGRCGAQTAIRILRGERPGSIAPQILESSVPTYDWRQLQRWGIPESNLPPGSIVRFRQPDFWQLYRGRILGLAAVCLLQTALIVGLFVQRKQNERQQHDFNRLLLAAHEAERARLARELHDDITQRMARLAIDLGRAGSPATDQTRSQIREELIRLSDDVHALSYQLHPSILEDLGLEEALRTDVDHFTRREGIPVELRLDKVAPGLPPATALGLYRIAQEALRNVARHARASEVRVNLESAAGELRLTIGDNGAGFDPARQSGRPSLGLAGMKERASLLGGRIEIDSRPGKGTIVAVSVPLNGD
ncbi:MAG: sensor histidine kinase, partial [Verrucomicrobiota bacterium]